MSSTESKVTFDDVKAILDRITNTYTADGGYQRQAIYGRHTAHQEGWETEEQLRSAVFNPRNTPHQLLEEKYLTGKREDALKTALIQVLLPDDKTDKRRTPCSDLPSMPPPGRGRRKATDEEIETIVQWICGLKPKTAPHPLDPRVDVAPAG